MLPGVQLHPAEPGLPVDFSLHRGAGLQGAAAQVNHRVPPLPDIQHRDIPQPPGIRRLSAPLGVKAGGVQNNLKALLRFRAGAYLPPEPGPVGIFVV